jgi:3-oxoacyl-[acyl-carrier-protein] synthase-3
VFRSASYAIGAEIGALASCDFAKLLPVSNEEVLARAGRTTDERLLHFLSNEMGIRRRFVVPKGTSALDLARDALDALLRKDPGIRDEAEFLIFGGISSPMPTVCMAALLANEYGFAKASCWDLKSGCSTGVLGFAQAIDWFQHGAKAGVLVTSETFSRFTDPTTLALSASTGDGACALSVRPSSAWRVRGVVHGTDATYFKSAYVPGAYPVDVERYRAEDYVFAFDDKPQTIAALKKHWVESLRDLLVVSEIAPERVTHYVSHQVDGKKNRAIAEACGISERATAMNFADFGNMGCPTVFLNYERFLEARPGFAIGDVLVLHAVGGGISYAGICLEKIG